MVHRRRRGERRGVVSSYFIEQLGSESLPLTSPPHYPTPDPPQLPVLVVLVVLVVVVVEILVVIMVIVVMMLGCSFDGGDRVMVVLVLIKWWW